MRSDGPSKFLTARRAAGKKSFLILKSYADMEIYIDARINWTLCHSIIG